MHTYIYTKWKVHLVIAKEIMALITNPLFGVCLQALLEQASPSSLWPCFLWRFYLCLSNFDCIFTFSNEYMASVEQMITQNGFASIITPILISLTTNSLFLTSANCDTCIFAVTASSGRAVELLFALKGVLTPWCFPSPPFPSLTAFLLYAWFSSQMCTQRFQRIVFGCSPF